MVDKALLADWIRHAANDLTVAHHLIEDMYPKQTEIAVYESHQCVEKALKLFLVANEIEPPKIHNLNKLVKLCMDIDGVFSEIEIDCANHNPFGSITRYPNELAADETIAKAAISRAQKIYDFCVAKTNLLMQNEESKNK
jgi:HEPN domain-containing protein